ncbi:U-box domain-containing protein [Aquicella lusitana]|uniref:U-box domain-containing protein n=1 Tax=Aquicella lusitana TaxID=254246 RepID=A0A370GCQ9_9COXI|nr:U-box domain-containing protein [Aquicella lusitana]RDI41000.1 U-box domain-containing protein [Aquicella lusitana]VVC73595.1 hypothetical protein AQULUS_13420 [Aquicella lusitana]
MFSLFSSSGIRLPSILSLPAAFKMAEPTFTLYRDGIGFGGFSLRLSNLPLNLSRMQWAAVVALSFLQTQLVEGAGDGEKMDVYYFKVNNTDYQVELYKHIQQFKDIAQRFQAECGVNASALPALFDYELIRQWGNSACFWRGLGELQYSDVESCVELMVEAALALNRETSLNTLRVVGGVVGGLAALCIGTGVFRYLWERCRHSVRPETSTRALEEGQVEREPLLSGQEQEKLPEAKKTFAERLEAVGFTIKKLEEDPIGKHFICPIMQALMEEPAVTNDGHSYEMEAIQKQKEVNGNSPLERDVRITSIAPNKALKALIIEFVERQERKAKMQASLFPPAVNVKPSSQGNTELKLRHSR